MQVKQSTEEIFRPKKITGKKLTKKKNLAVFSQRKNARFSSYPPPPPGLY